MGATKTKEMVCYDLIGDHVECEHFGIKSLLSSEVVDYIEKHRLTQQEVGKRMGVTDKLDCFTFDMLVSVLERIGVSPLHRAG